MSFQHVAFNFGNKAFKYPPIEYEFRNFNEFNNLSNDKKYVLPK